MVQVPFKAGKTHGIVHYNYSERDEEFVWKGKLPRRIDLVSYCNQVSSDQLRFGFLTGVYRYCGI